MVNAVVPIPFKTIVTSLENLNQVRDILLSSTKVIISTHYAPDADAIGSEVALALALKQMGKEVKIINPSGFPDNLQFLVNHFPANSYSSINSKLKSLDADTIVVVDTSQSRQFEDVSKLMLSSNAVRICIDHHPNPENLFHFKLMGINYPATGILIYKLISTFPGFKLTKEIAESLYAAIMTDTGSFRFPKTTGEVHQITSKLVDAGANPTTIYENLYETGSKERLNLLGRALQSLQLWENGKISIIIIRKKDFVETKTSVDDLDNVVNYGFTIKGVKVSLMVVELNENYKISFRSKGNFPANKLAQFFSGGGHLNAAGARYKSSSLEDVVNELNLRTKELLNSN